MNASPLTPLEDRLRRAAAGLVYPRTPDVSRAARKRLAQPRLNGVRLTVRVAAALLVLLAAALAVPQVRAKLIEFFQIGVIRVLPADPSLTPGAIPSGPAGGVPMTATLNPDLVEPSEPDHEVTIAGLAGETTLAQAQLRVPFTIRLPRHPADLGPPDRVFLQSDGPMVILAWMDPEAPEEVRLSLHQIGPEAVYITKFQPRLILETQVNGVPALWAQGPYLMQLTSGREEFRRLVNGNTLIWEVDGITYRLETDLALKEALRIAESIE